MSGVGRLLARRRIWPSSAILINIRFTFMANPFAPEVVYLNFTDSQDYLSIGPSGFMEMKVSSDACCLCSPSEPPGAAATHRRALWLPARTTPRLAPCARATATGLLRCRHPAHQFSLLAGLRDDSPLLVLRLRSTRAQDLWVSNGGSVPYRCCSTEANVVYKSLDSLFYAFNLNRDGFALQVRSLSLCPSLPPPRPLSSLSRPLPLASAAEGHRRPCRSASRRRPACPVDEASWRARFGVLRRSSSAAPSCCSASRSSSFWAPASR